MMRFLISLCVPLLLLVNGEIINGQTSAPTTSSSDPCYNYTIINDFWRDVRQNQYYSNNDNLVDWNGWYRFYLNGASAQMSEWCVSYAGCGGETALFLSGSHPKLEDVVVTRAVSGNYQWNYYSQCGNQQLSPIQVKACPGHYYIYKLVKPDMSVTRPSYCAVTFNNTVSDPCYNYESLDRPWRASNESGFYVCDESFSWNGWHRLFYNGMNIRMPESCVNYGRCNTYFSLWLNGPHPHIQDGVVTREICASSWMGCCNMKSTPIRVKACPGDYYVYEFVKPPYGCSGYCTDVGTTSSVTSTTTPAVFTGSYMTTSAYDPCYKYNILDDDYRSVRSFTYMYSHDDTRVEWDGWYRHLVNGSSAQMPEWCFSYMSCGGFSSLWLVGSHPYLYDGIVTREVYGSVDNRCRFYTSNPIQVKACPGNYYVYKFIRPKLSIIMPVYCTVAFANITNDPCYNYESLDRPWRASNDSGLHICDGYSSWTGWYRLFYNGMNIRMPESCVSPGTCNTYFSLWLNGPHPHIQDGVVTREICARSQWGGCCDLTSHPIRVKACPGDYYVYEFVKPQPYTDSGYCTDINTLSEFIYSTSPALVNESSLTLSAISSDPCNDYNILEQHWRSTFNYWNWNGYDDTRVKWDGWYRLFINGSSAQMPEWCFSYMTCGGFSSLWLGGPHPKIHDGFVTREVYGTQYVQCSYYRSKPIQVKACPGNYHVYKLPRPKLSIPHPVYCAVPFSSPNIDPCYSYTSLDEPWRASNSSYISYTCDYNVTGWHRLFYSGLNAQMPESCVGYGMCGSYIPLWLNGSHPQLEDGVVTREVCMSLWHDCCAYKSHPIRVKACPGNYYVYQFVIPMYCGTYCTDHTRFHTSSPSSVTYPATRDPCSDLNCTENEWCGEHNGVYGCFCNQTQPTSNPDTFDAYEMCESSSGFMSLSRCQLFEAGFSADVLHLNDPSCRGTVQNERVEFRFDNNGSICGTGLVANGTHIIYENFIFGQQGSAGGVISRKKFLKLRFNCVYHQTQSVSMDINPLESIVHRNIQGLGTYRVRMLSYQDAQFSKPFTGSVSVEVDQKIFVEVRVDGVDDRQFASVIDTCWATPVNDPQSFLRWDLIVDECPNPNDNTVELLQNGVSTSSRFSFRMFIFTANSTKVYLHCKIHLCLLTNNTCSSQCQSGQHLRVGRSLDFHDTASISMGPLVWSKGNSDILAPEPVKVSRAAALCVSLMFLFVLVLSAYIVF
ncbi:uncharacterized protein LOC130568775 isoform X2 [Triplophysa rosa]|uniref:uncharacterized protein LOC130568775 isoform X2 n=1 Tax=Triplophysa rosa TaxID=992332 RepID=UPI0025461DCE|nr:uncharacterized protein LOC130568775 isoform X2 [Triplophysa rosa]